MQNLKPTPSNLLKLLFHMSLALNHCGYNIAIDRKDTAWKYWNEAVEQVTHLNIVFQEWMNNGN